MVLFEAIAGLSGFGIGSSGLRIAGLVLLLGSLMTVELALNPAEAVGAGADQLSLYVFQFILVEFQLGLSQIDLLLQGVSSAIIFRAGELLLQLVNSVVIGSYRCVGLISVSIEFLAFGRWRSGMLGGLAHLVTESDIYGMIGQLQCLARISLFFPVGREGHHCAGSQQRLLIHDRRSAPL